MKYLDALKQGGKEPTKSLVPETENKMQPGTRAGQRGNGLDRNNPQSLISGTHQEQTAGGTSNEKGAVAALARQLNVDLSTVKGTGPRGTVTEKDVRAAYDANQQS